MGAATSKTYGKIETMSGWDSCSACAGAGGGATYYMKQFVSSPSLNGASTEYHVGGSVPFSHALFWKHLDSGDSSVHNFKLDLDYYLTNPTASGGLEFNVNQSVSGHHYQYSIQCSFISHVWKVWDTANARWAATTIPCGLPSALAWHHATFELQRTTSNKALFVSITVDGVKHYVNESFYSVSSSSSSLGVHYQINGNANQSSYSTWVNNLTLAVY